MLAERGAVAHGAPSSITPAEFAQFQRFIFDAAGITLASTKAALVSGRLGKRLVHNGLDNYADYLRMLTSGSHPAEVQMAVDLLTTNETYFFRESKHFDFLRTKALSARSGGRSFRVWSAAASSGEEAYSIAMVLADCLGGAPWEVLGTDISQRVLQSAARGIFRMERARHIPPAYLHRYCLKGTEEHEGTLMVDRTLRARVSFVQANLNAPLPDLGAFDLIFLRNVLIYFNDETKRQVVDRVSAALRPGGHFLVGHSESLHGITDALRAEAPSIYCRAC
jgi:chemotaxis protein methyltransferase CheR